MERLLLRQSRDPDPEASVVHGDAVVMPLLPRMLGRRQRDVMLYLPQLPRTTGGRGPS